MKVFYYFLFALFSLFLACEDPTDVGSTIIPDGDALEVDSISFTDFVFNNHRDDSILNSSTTQIQLGQFHNNTFGKSTASYYTELFYGENFNVVEGAIFDSLILYLNVNGFQGDTLVAQTINVYEMNEQLKISTSDEPDLYYMFETVEKGNLITQISDVLFENLTTSVNETESGRHIKATLPNDFGEPLFNLLNNEETEIEQVQEYLNGLVFEPDNNSNGKGWFSIATNVSLPNLTGLYFYYHDEEEENYSQRVNLSVVNDFISADDEIFYGAQNLNPIINTYEQAESQLQTQLDNPTDLGYEQAYLQGGNGTFLSIDFEELLDDFDISDPVINLAEFTINVDLTNRLEDTLYLPTSLFLAEEFITNDEGEKTGGLIGIDGSGLSNTADLSRYERRGNATAFLRQERNDDGEPIQGKYVYSFSIPKTIQSIHDGIINPKLYLFSNSRSQSFYGVKFDKSNTELKLFYTKTD